MKILITGGCGYIGYSLTESLAQNKRVSEIRIYDNLQRFNNGFFYGKSKENNSKIKFIQGDILDEYTLLESCKEIDVVYHLAAKVLSPFSDKFNHEFDQINNWGSANVASVIERSKSVKKAIYLSSASIYGPTNNMTIDEDFEVSPISVYGISKYKGEEHFLRLANQISISILRSGNIYGFNPSMRVDGVIHKMLFDAHTSNKIFIHGDGKQKRSFVNIRSIVEKLIGPIADVNTTNIRNVAEIQISINEIGQLIKSIYGDIDIFYLNQHADRKNISITSKYDKNMSTTRDVLVQQLLEIKNQFRIGN